MKGTMARAAGLFAAPASQVARLAQALADKRAEEGGAAPAEAAPEADADSAS
jgi:large subunit ribosomal protein L10